MASPLSSKSARPTPNCECVSCGISFHTANPERDACPRCLLTPKQRDINHRLLSAPKRHTLLYGGARSGKTVLFVRAIMMRAIHAPETRHAMLRLRANAARASLWLDTLPKVQWVFFPKFTLRDHRQDGYVEIVESGSQIWIARATGRGRDRQTRLGPALRPRPRRHFCGAGRDHRGGDDRYRSSHRRRRTAACHAQAAR